MVENNSVEPDVKKPEVTGCRNVVGWGCLISLVLSLAITGYFLYSVSHGRRADAIAYSDAVLSSNAAEKYFADHPSGELTLSRLNQYGYKKSKRVILTIIDGKMNSWKLKTEHPWGDVIWYYHKGDRHPKKK